MNARRVKARTVGHAWPAQVIAIAAMIAIGVGLGSSGAGAETGQAIGVAPTPGATGLSSGGSYFAPSVDAGSSFSSSILLANPNSDSVKVDIYSVDGLTSAGSGTAYSNQGDPVTGAGNWVHVATPSLTLGPLSRTTVDFTVSVPAGTAPGDHLAGVAIEGVAPSATTGSGAVRVKVLARSVIGVLVRVPGNATYGMSIGSIKLGVGTYGIGEVSSQITNTGGLLVRPFIVDTLQGPNGYDQSYTRALDTILPGDTTTYQLFWPSKLQGTYSIKSCVYGGGLNAKICDTGTGTLAGSTQTQTHNRGAFPTPTKSSSGFPLVALLAIVIIGGLGLVGGGLLFGIRLTRRRMLAQIAANGTTAAPPGSLGDDEAPESNAQD